MCKKTGALLGLLLMLGVFLAPTTFGGVPKIVIIENFGATW